MDADGFGSAGAAIVMAHGASNEASSMNSRKATVKPTYFGHSGARAKRGSPESITPILSASVPPVVMDSGFARKRAPRNDAEEYEAS